MDTRSAYEVLEDKLSRTKAARFAAYARLKRQDALSSLSLTLWSVVLLLLSIQGLAVDTDIHGLMISKFFYFVPQDWLNSIGVLGSLLILVLALVEQTKSYAVNAEHMHNSAKFINSLYSELRLANEYEKGGSLRQNLTDISRRYHDHINGCGINHTQIDNDMASCGDNSYKSVWLNICLALNFSLYYILIVSASVFILYGIVAGCNILG